MVSRGDEIHFIYYYVETRYMNLADALAGQHLWKLITFNLFSPVSWLNARSSVVREPRFPSSEGMGPAAQAKVEF